MPIDFDSLVVNPCMDTFAISIVVTPTTSQPQAPAYSARGVWAMRDTTLMLDDGSMLSTVTLTMGIRLAEFPVWPASQDVISIPQSSSNVSAGVYLVDMIQPDGQGGAKLTLKSKQSTVVNPI